MDEWLKQRPLRVAFDDKDIPQLGMAADLRPTTSYELVEGDVVYTMHYPRQMPAFQRPTPTRVADEAFYRLQRRLNTNGDLFAPTVGTVVEESGGRYRIDRQPPPPRQYNWQYQAGNHSLAVTLADEDTRMFGSTAIGFARNALILSFRDGHKYYIAVTRRKRHDRPIPVHPGFPFRARKLVHEAEQAIQSLLARMAKGNASVEKAEAAIAKAVRKAMAEFGPKEVAEDIPLVGFFTGLFFSALRLWDGDYRKASEEFVAGLAGEFPGPGWAISTAINVDLLAADVKEFVATEQSRAQAGRAEAEAAEKAIELEWLQLAELNNGSPIFGAAQGSVNMLFDDLAFAHKGKLSAVFIRSGEAINGIQAFYGSAAPHAVAAPYHGRGQLLGGQPHLFVLREGEHLVGIEVWHGGHIDAMVLYTSSGRHSQKFGGRGGHRDFYRAPEGMRISSFRGYVDEVVLRLGVSISPLEEHPVLAHVPRGVSLTLPQERCVYRIEPHGGTDRGRTMLSCTSGGVVDLFGFDDQSGRQQWTFVHVSDDFYNILVASGTHSHALMLSTTPDGKTVDLFGHDDGSGRQRWRLTPLQSSNGTFYRIEVSGGVKNDRLLSCTPDGKVDLFGRDDDSGRQKWKLVLLGWPKL